MEPHGLLVPIPADLAVRPQEVGAILGWGAHPVSALFEKHLVAQIGIPVKLLELLFQRQVLLLQLQRSFSQLENLLSGLKTMLGCMIESSILISAAAHLAELCDYLDLDGNILITNDPYIGVTAEKGVLSFANAPEKFGLRVCAR